MQPLNLISNEISLEQLLRQYHAGAYQLPAFQRPFVWKPWQILNLLDSLLKGYPISVIYLWKPSPGSQLQRKPRPVKSKQGPPEVDRFEAFIIDGQQRLTSLQAAFGLTEAYDDREGGNRRSLECWLELDAQDETDGRVTRLFQCPAQKKYLSHEYEQQRPWRLRLGDLLSVPYPQMRSDRAEQLKLAGLSSEQIDRALSRIDAAYAMLKTRITCITITDAEDDRVLDVFKRLNRGGTGLKDRDVKAADLGIGKPVEVLRAIQAFVNEVQPTALGFGFSFAFRALVAFHRGTAMFKELPRSWAELPGDREQSLLDSWGDAEAGLRTAMAVVDSMGWCRKPLLPSCNGLIPLAYALQRLKRKPDASERKLITRWFCLAALRGVFRGSVEQVINRQLNKIKKAGKRPLHSLLETLKVEQARPITSDELTRSPTTLWGPFSQVMFAWLVAQEAQDWITGQSLDKIAHLSIGTPHPEEKLTIQHISPRKLLSDQDYEQDWANYPGNFAIIGGSPNSSLQDLSPREAMQRLDSQERRDRARVQFFSTDAGDLLDSDRYEEFLDWRARRLAEA